MPEKLTTSELGRALRLKYPNAYSSGLTDHEIGLAVKRKYPSDYEQVAEDQQSEKSWGDMQGFERLAFLGGKIKDAIPKTPSEIGEFGGGLVGGIAGGMAGGFPAILGAGAGAAGGKALGLKIEGKPVLASDLAKTAALNATGEGVGRSIPFLIRGVKQAPELLGGMMRKAVPPTDEAAMGRLVQLSKRYGVPVDIADLSGSNKLQRVKAALAHSLFGGDTIREAQAGQQQAWLKSVDDLIDRFKVGQIDEETFGSLAEQVIREARNKFNQRMNNAVAGAGKSLNPTPVSREAAGNALKLGREAKVQNLYDTGDDLFTEVRGLANQEAAKRGVLPGNAIDLTPLNKVAENVLSGLPPGQLRGLVSGGSTASKVAAGSAPIVDEEVAALIRGLEEAYGVGIDRIPKKVVGAVIGDRAAQSPTTMSMNALMKLRSALTKGIEKSKDPSHQAILVDLVNGLDASVESSVGPDVLNAYRAARAKYSELYKPLFPKPLGGSNPTAATIMNADPERIPGKIVSPGAVTDIREAALASGPQSMNLLKRNIFDDLAGGATVPEGLGSRVSPTAMQSGYGKLGSDTTTELFGGRAPLIEGIFSPDILSRESLLYDSSLAKKATALSNSGLRSTAFPGRSPDAVQQTLSLFDEAGRLPEARSAFGTMIRDKSTRASTQVAGKRTVTPNGLSRTIEQMGPQTIEIGLGKAPARQLGEISELGNTLWQTEAKFGNPSGTAGVTDLLSLLRNLTSHPIKGVLQEGANLFGRAQLGKAIVSPRVSSGYINPPPPINVPNSEASVYGALARLLAMQGFQ